MDLPNIYHKCDQFFAFKVAAILGWQTRTPSADCGGAARSSRSAILLPPRWRRHAPRPRGAPNGALHVLLKPVHVLYLVQTCACMCCTGTRSESRFAQEAADPHFFFLRDVDVLEVHPNMPLHLRVHIMYVSSDFSLVQTFTYLYFTFFIGTQNESRFAGCLLSPGWWRDPLCPRGKSNMKRELN